MNYGPFFLFSAFIFTISAQESTEHCIRRVTQECENLSDPIKESGTYIGEDAIPLSTDQTEQLLAACPCIEMNQGLYKIEGRAGAFFPFSSRIRDIFQIALPFVELEGSYKFSSKWDIWGAIGYIFATKESLNYGTVTTINMIPFTLGVRRFFSLAYHTDAFLGFGGLWSLYRNHDNSPWVHQHISKSGFGGTATAGLLHRLSDSFLMNFFVEYMYLRFPFSKVYPKHFTYRHDVNMSGIKVGLGIAYNF